MAPERERERERERDVHGSWLGLVVVVEVEREHMLERACMHACVGLRTHVLEHSGMLITKCMRPCILCIGG